MSLCKRPCAIALSGPGRFTYLFGDLDPECHAAAILDLAARYAEAPQGYLARADRPEPLRSAILGRLPPLVPAPTGGMSPDQPDWRAADGVLRPDPVLSAADPERRW